MIYLKIFLCVLSVCGIWLGIYWKKYWLSFVWQTALIFNLMSLVITINEPVIVRTVEIMNSKRVKYLNDTYTPLDYKSSLDALKIANANDTLWVDIDNVERINE